MIKTSIKNTLIIDNDEVGNTALINIFAENGLKLHIVSQQIDYLHLLEQHNFDCIMINGEFLNNMTYKIINEIKGNYPWIIIFIILTNPAYEVIFDYVRHGADDFLLRPFTWEDIEKLLKYYYF